MSSHHRVEDATATPLPPAALSPTHHQHPGRRRQSQGVPLANRWPGGARGCLHGGCWGGSASSLRLGRSRSCSSQGPRPRLHGPGTLAGPAQRGRQAPGLASHHRTPNTEHLWKGEAAKALPSCHHHQDFPSLSFLILLGTPTPREVGANRDKLGQYRLWEVPCRKVILSSREAPGLSLLPQAFDCSPPPGAQPWALPQVLGGPLFMKSLPPGMLQVVLSTSYKLTAQALQSLCHFQAIRSGESFHHLSWRPMCDPLCSTFYSPTLRAIAFRSLPAVPRGMSLVLPWPQAFKAPSTCLYLSVCPYPWP